MKFLGQRKSDSINCVHIRVAVRKSLLDRAGNFFAGGTQIRRRLVNCVQRKTARPDVRVSEITVDVDPTGETKNCGAALHLSRAPKFRMRKIVVVRLENERRAGPGGEKVADVFPGIMSRRTEFGETQAA